MAHAHDKAGYIAATELAWEKDRNRARIRGESIYRSTADYATNAWTSRSSCPSTTPGPRSKLGASTTMHTDPTARSATWHRVSSPRSVRETGRQKWQLS